MSDRDKAAAKDRKKIDVANLTATLSEMALPQRDDSLREFEFSNQDFERVRAMIYRHAGISLNQSKHEMVYSRLARRLRARGMVNFRDYLALLENGDEQEWEAFVNSLTTNLTAFFREAHHFDILAKHLESLRGKRQSLTIWSSASSTGEEPYSIAMTVADVWGGFNAPVKIIASDLDTQVLAKAEAGVYPAERIERIPPEQVKRYFLRGTGAQSGMVRVRDELKQMVTFRRVNLLDHDWNLRGPLDAIFCRNVMIYFDKPTQIKILERFLPLLRPEGLLFVGHSESFFQVAHLFKLRGKTVYEVVDKNRACRD